MRDATRFLVAAYIADDYFEMVVVRSADYRGEHRGVRTDSHIPNRRVLLLRSAIRGEHADSLEAEPAEAENHEASGLASGHGDLAALEPNRREVFENETLGHPERGYNRNRLIGLEVGLCG